MRASPRIKNKVPAPALNRPLSRTRGGYVHGLSRGIEQTLWRLLRWFGVQRADVDAVVLLIRHEPVIEEMLSVRQEGWTALPLFTMLRVQRCDRSRLSAGGRDTIHNAGVPEQDHVVRRFQVIPPRVRGGRQGLRRSARDIDLLDTAACLETRSTGCQATRPAPEARPRFPAIAEHRANPSGGATKRCARRRLSR